MIRIIYVFNFHHVYVSSDLQHFLKDTSVQAIQIYHLERIVARAIKKIHCTNQTLSTHRMDHLLEPFGDVCLVHWLSIRLEVNLRQSFFAGYFWQNFGHVWGLMRSARLVHVQFEFGFIAIFFRDV